MAFFLPGVIPDDFKAGSPLIIFASQANSIRTHIAYNYYQLQFCTPDRFQVIQNNVGDKIMGNALINTPYKIRMMMNTECELLCTQEFSEEGFKMQQLAIERDYHYTWFVDNLPSAYVTRDENSPQIKYDSGIPIGFQVLRQNNSDKQFYQEFYIYNHHEITIQVHETMDDSNSYRIVGFKVEPISVKQDIEKQKCSASDITERQQLLKDQPIQFTYSIKFEKSELLWASRWDHYLQMGDNKVHWVSIINSFLIVLCLAGLIAHIMSKALKRDLTQYELMKQKQQEKLHKQNKKNAKKNIQYQNVPSTETGGDVIDHSINASSEDHELKIDENPVEQKKEEEFVLDEIAWKKVKGDVFRKPKYAMILSILVGTGLQIFAMTFFLLVFACIGLISPKYRGTLMSALYFFFILLSNVSGYYTARFYKMFQGTDWLLCTILVSFAYPSFVFIIFLIVNFATWFERSLAAVPFPTILVLLFIFCTLSVPNVWVGAFIGFKKPTIKNPGKINKLSRDIPLQPWYLRMKFLIPLGGILPFAAVFIEMLNLMQSIWRSYFYYMFGFLFLILLILIIACAEVAIVQTYFQLCAENFQWWWRSFFITASSGIYLFLFSIYYYGTQLNMMRFSSGLVYFSVMFLISISFSLMTGTIGFYASFTFNRKIYSMIKSD